MELPIATYFKWNKPGTEQEMMKKLTIDAKVIENLGDDIHPDQE